MTAMATVLRIALLRRACTIAARPAIALVRPATTPPAPSPPHHPRRPFSHTPRPQHPIPLPQPPPPPRIPPPPSPSLFPRTTNLELDTLLAHLTYEQPVPATPLERRALFRHHYAETKIEERLYFTLAPNDPQTNSKDYNQQLTKRLFTRCLQTMRCPSDFDALPGIIMGFAQSRRGLVGKQLKSAARRAGLNGRADIFNAILEQSKFNGVRITAMIAREVLRGYVVPAGLSDPEYAAKAVADARRFWELVAAQDEVVAWEYDQCATALAEKKTPAGIEAQLGPRPVPIAGDPVCRGLLAGVAAMAARVVHGGVDVGGHTAGFTKQLLAPESWRVLAGMLATPLTELDQSGPRRLRRWQFYDENKITINWFLVLREHLRVAEQVLAHTAAHLQARPEGTDESLFPHDAAEVQGMVERLRAEIPLIEATLEHWIEEWAPTAADVMGWDVPEARKRLEKALTAYDWAREMVGKWLLATKEGREWVGPVGVKENADKGRGGAEDGGEVGGVEGGGQRGGSASLADELNQV